MDILMTYWNSVWRTAVTSLDHTPHSHSIDEWAAYDRSLQRPNPISDSKERGVPDPSPSAQILPLDSTRRIKQ